jgi:nucleotide-binding universal stress UspA family protein
MTAKQTYRILVPIDFSEPSILALQRAVEEARLRGGTVTLLHVVDLGALAGHRGGTLPHLADLAKLARVEAEGEIQRVREGADPAGTSIDEKTEVVQGHPAETILARARSGAFDRLVIGTRGETGLAYEYMGSVAERVAHCSPCDVLVVHPPRRR